MTQAKARRPFILLLPLSICLLLLASMSLTGGVQLLQDPSGNLLGMPDGYLQFTPFQNYALPGLWLVVVYGFGSLGVLFALWVQPIWPTYPLDA